MELKFTNNHFQYRCLGYGEYGPVFEFRQDQAIFVFQNGSDSPWGPPILLFFSFPGVKLSGREVRHSPYIAEVKNKWSYTSAPYMPSWHGQGQLYFHHFIVLSRPAIERINCM